MGSQQGPLRRIVSREGSEEILECGHRQHKKANAAMRRRCRQCIEIRRMSVTLHERKEVEAGQRCTFCFDLFEDSPDEPTRSCPRCKTKLHAECWEEHGGCTVLGCRETGHVRIRPRAPQATQPALRRLSMRARIASFLDIAGFPLAFASWILWHWWVGLLVYVAVFTLRWLVNGRR